MNKEIINIFRSFGYKHDLRTLFFDYIEMLACALSNRVLGNVDWQKREQRFLELKEKYLSEYSAFIKLTALITEEVVSCAGDMLGELAAELNVLNKRHGQFFTPHDVSILMAKITMGDIDYVPQGQVLRISEPACGSGGIVLAAAEVLSEKCKIDKQLLVVAQDIDRWCVHASYIQFAIRRIPAVVILGNTLTLECREQWITPVIFENIEIFKDYIFKKD